MKTFSPEFEAMTAAIREYTSARCDLADYVNHGSHESLVRPAESRNANALAAMDMAIERYLASSSPERRRLKWLGGEAHRRYHGTKGCGQSGCRACVPEPR